MRFFGKSKYISNFSVVFKDFFIFYVEDMGFYIDMKNKVSLLEMLINLL